MSAETRSTAPLAVGIAGLGSLGERLAEQFRRHEGVDLRAISDPDAATLETAGEAFGIDSARSFTSYDAMLADATLDAVAIATPNGLHYEQAMAALDRDLHVLLEKPIATDVAEGYDLTQRAEASDTVVMLGFQRHLNPVFRAGRERWAIGDADPLHITGELTHDWRTYFETMDNWRMDPERSGGGHLLNVGIHVVEAINWMTGLTPATVSATVGFADDERLIDTHSSTTVEFADGTIATVTDTGIVPQTREHIHIWDGAGALYIQGREWDDRTGYTIDTEGIEHDLDAADPRPKADAFVEAIETGAEPPSTARDALWALAVVMAAYESGRRDERIELLDLYPFLADLT